MDRGREEEMRVFVAGATGVIGRPLVAALLAAGHEVTGMTRSRAAAEQLASKGAEPVVSDAYDAEAVREAVVKAEPQVVVHQLTALPRAIDPRRIGEQLADNDRLRVQGTRNLLRAAVLAGAGRLVAQSIAFAYAPVGGPVKGEDAPLWLDAFEPWRRSVRAIADLEHQVTTTPGIEGVVLRYGNLYGPATAYAADGAVADLVRARRYPIAGKGAGVYSFVHLDDAVAATVAALDAQPVIYNVVDDEPAPLSEWLPAYAQALAAPPPRRVPVWLARLMAGRYGAHLMTEQRGASNAKAKQTLGWAPTYPSWRTGFRTGLG
jgi:2-alkyl-3-oxoalkanoate reductase